VVPRAGCLYKRGMVILGGPKGFKIAAIDSWLPPAQPAMVMEIFHHQQL